MRMKGQSAIEFLTTYAWVFIMISIFVAVVSSIALSNSPTTYIPSSCFLEPELPCSASAMYTNTTEGNSMFIILITNKLGVSLELPHNAINVTIVGGNSKSYLGQCRPNYVASGGIIVCNATISAYHPAPGTQASQLFTLSYAICSPNCSGAYNTTGYSSLTTSINSNAISLLDTLLAKYHGPLTVDGSGTGSIATGGTTGTITLSTKYDGDIIIVAAAANPAGSVVSTVTGAGLTFHHRESIGGANSPVEEWYAMSVFNLSSEVIHVTYSSPVNAAALFAFGVAGENYTRPFDPLASLPYTNVGLGYTLANVIVSTSKPNDFVIDITGEINGNNADGSAILPVILIRHECIYPDACGFTGGFTTTNVLTNQILNSSGWAISGNPDWSVIGDAVTGN